MSIGVQMIKVERDRQIEKEGWTEKHDQQHSPGALALAGAVYAIDVARQIHAYGDNGEKDMKLTVDMYWPFDKKWWKPTDKDPVRQLVKAGALIAAEIDRMIASQGKHPSV